MQEKVGKRSWVNIVIIVFLIILLVLTFFSNTIRNRNLSECTTATVGYGTIDSKVRGSGTVSAKESYELKASDTRKVKSVLVNNGQTVTAGEVLLILEAGESSELAEEEETLRQMQLAYQRSVISAFSADYTVQNRAIEETQTAIDEAVAARDAMDYRPESVSEHKTNLDAALSTQAAAQTAYDKAYEDFLSIGGLIEVDGNGNTLSKLKSELESKKAIYSEEYAFLASKANELIKEKEAAAYNRITSEASRKSFLEARYSVYIPYYLSTLSDDITDNNASEPSGTPDVGGEDNPSDIPSTNPTYNPEADDSATEPTPNPTPAPAADSNNDASEKLPFSKDQLQKAYYEISSAQSAYDSAVDAYYSGPHDNSYEYNKLKKDADAKKLVLDTANKDVETKQAAYDLALEKKAEYDGYADTISQLQKTLEDQIFNLEQQQKADGKTQTLEWLDINEQKRKIDEQQAKVDELKAAEGEEGETEIKAPVSGVIREISIAPGNKTSPDGIILKIEIKDMGYSLSFSVTNEQAKLIRKGDTGELTNMWWGGNIYAEVTDIKSDPQNPRTNKMIYFSVTGDVSDGETLDLSVGRRSAEFDSVVPKAALKSDNNGDFVYVVNLKSSPLGNRYIAERVNVEVVARDDKNVAVSGALDYGAYVVVNSSLPISNGSQVRLAGQ